MRPLAIGIIGLLAAASLCTHVARAASQEYAQTLIATRDLRRGAQVYEMTCRICHGHDGEGVAEGSVPVPVTGGQYFRVIAKALVDFRHGDRLDSRMEHFGNERHVEGVQDIAAVAAYIESLRPRTAAGLGSGAYVSRGARAYLRHCESCHGAIGEGDPSRSIPKVGGQHYNFLLRRFRGATEGTWPKAEGEAHARLLSHLSDQDLAGVADYLSRLMPH